MSEVKRGDVVILLLGGKDYNALVHQVNRTEASHLGAHQEPTLHLSYVPDEPIVNGKPKVMPVGYIPSSEMIYDVVHASHEFSREYMKQHNLREVQEHDLHRTVAEAEIRNRRGAGEWREVPATEFADEAKPAAGLPLTERRHSITLTNEQKTAEAERTANAVADALDQEDEKE
jgi:hypothetical protein